MAIPASAGPDVTARVGAPVSTLTWRVTAGEAAPAPSTDRNDSVWAPSVSAVAGAYDQVAPPVPQAGQEIPPIDQVAPSTATSMRPPVPATDERVGATVSTVTDRLVAADAREALSTARKATVWTPSARAVPGRNVQVAEAVPQPVQVTPLVANAALSTLASTRARPLPVSAAVPP